MGTSWFPDLKSWSHFPGRAELLRRSPTDDLTAAGSANGGPNGGLTQAPEPHPTGNPPNAKSSVAIPVVVLLILAIFSASLLWWILARLRRSRRVRAPIVTVPEDNHREKPMLWGFEIGDAKQWGVTRWSQLEPIAVGFVSDADRTRWDATPACISPPKHNTPSDPLPSPNTSTLRPSSPFGMFSRSPSPATTLVSDEACALTVTVFVAMPSSNRPKADGELYLGVARSAL
ncbi:hypothetical protein C8Q73DRAFT_668551 [Cubamyces lactineus]|nr:hypothetical protein C8Q73DRAFT_668551 [Cubamyces lactineus]